MASCVRASSARSRSTPCARERIGQRDAVAVGERAQLVLVAHRAGGGARAEEAAAEAGTLLVGPVDEAHGHGRLALLGDPPQHLHRREDVQAAVEPAAVRDGVDVAAEQDSPLGAAAQRQPAVAGLVVSASRRQARELGGEPLLRRCPRLGPGDPLGAVLVSGELL